MEPLLGTFAEPTTDYLMSWDDTGRCSLYPAPKEAFKRSAPPTHKGPRITDRLSQNAVRTIRGAVVKAAMLGHPFRVMWTFTVKATDEGGKWESPREAVATGALILSEEVSRTLDAFRQYRERQGDTRPFFYVWVAENPPAGTKDERNGKGQAVAGTGGNPHVHLISNWTFEPSKEARTNAAKSAEFQVFTAYLENLYGLGFVHVEFLTDVAAAGAYLLKAAGYITKQAGQEQEPQPVRGQRWYVSDSVRPVKESRPVELDPETVRRLHALRYLGDKSPMRFDDNRVVFSRWCINGYRMDPEAFLARSVKVAEGYYLSPDFKPDAEALAEADRQQVNSTAEALADRHRQVAAQALAWEQDEEAHRARKAHGRAALEVVNLYGGWDFKAMPHTRDAFTSGGVLLWSRGPYEEDPDPLDLLPVA